MDIGVVLQCTPPAARVIDLAKRAEAYGFSHVWTFDSHILWEEPYVIYSKILDETRKVIVGPMVTNPATRDITVTASVFATLNEMYGNRTVIGIGRGDSAVRVTNGKPVSVDHTRQASISSPSISSMTTRTTPWPPTARRSFPPCRSTCSRLNEPAVRLGDQIRGRSTSDSAAGSLAELIHPLSHSLDRLSR